MAAAKTNKYLIILNIMLVAALTIGTMDTLNELRFDLSNVRTINNYVQISDSNAGRGTWFKCDLYIKDFKSKLLLDNPLFSNNSYSCMEYWSPLEISLVNNPDRAPPSNPL
jgi:hypothetical protein